MKEINTYFTELNLMRPDSEFKAALYYCFLPPKMEFSELTPHLGKYELNYFKTLRFEKRIRSYLIGHFAAKQAVAALTGEKRLANISIQPGIFNQPMVVPNHYNMQVSITHCDDFGAALAFPEAHPMAIDIERISPDKREVLEGQATDSEKEKCLSLPISYDAGLTLLWTVKEALSKVLKTGLMTPFDLYEVSKVECYDSYILGFYKNFVQYKVMSFTIDEYMCSIAYPLKTELYFNIQSIKANFTFTESRINITKYS